MTEEQPGSRAAELIVNTVAELVEHIQFVLDHPGIGGFDCMLNREVTADPASKQKAMYFALQGVKVKIIGAEGTPTHIAARVLVTPPVKIKPEDIPT